MSQSPEPASKRQRLLEDSSVAGTSDVLQPDASFLEAMEYTGVQTSELDNSGTEFKETLSFDAATSFEPWAAQEEVFECPEGSITTINDGGHRDLYDSMVDDFSTVCFGTVCIICLDYCDWDMHL